MSADADLPPASSPQDDAERVRALRAMRVLDSAPDPRFDRIVRTAALVFGGAARAAVILVDKDRLWMKAQTGVAGGSEWPRQNSLAEAALRQGRPIYTLDARTDPVFAKAAANHADAVFYASAPLRMKGGPIVGMLSVGDPRVMAEVTPAQMTALEDLASLAMEELVRDAEAAAARERQVMDRSRLELAFDAGGLGEFEWDIPSDTLFVSERLGRIVGTGGGVYAAEGGDVLFAQVHAEDLEEAREAVLGTLDAGDDRFTVRHRLIREDDRRVIWIHSWGVRLRGKDGQPSRIIGVSQDVTDEKQAAEGRETLVAELDHRVKNVLAAVQSLAAQSARRAASLDSFLKTFTGRLKAMASAHELLTATRWRGASIRNLAAAELGGVAPGQTRWEGPDLFLSPRAANALSLALHELATNAVKYGALSVEAGRVDVRWRTLTAGGFEVDWIESGGPIAATPTRRGFGTTLLERVTGRELGGDARLDFRPGGVRATLRADGSALARASEPPAEVAPPAPAPPAQVSSADDPTTSGAAIAAVGPLGDRIAGLRVAIVEDAVLLALELEAGLAEAGATIVGTAADIDEALALAAKPMDAAVLDANLNGASVAPVAEALRARGVPFLFATGYGDAKTAVMEGLAAFGAPVLRKPYDVTQVAAALGELTGRR